MPRPTGPRVGNSALLSSTISHAIIAERFKNAEARRILRVLEREVLPDLVARLSGRLENIRTRGFDTGPATTQRLKYLYRDLRQFFSDLATRVRDETEPRLVGFATATAKKLARQIKAEVGGLASITTPSEGMLRQAVIGRPFDGALLRETWEARGATMRRAVEKQVRIGLVQGETPQAIIRRVRGAWPTERRKVAQSVRAAISHAQAQARQATFEENGDVVEGVLWVATLDASTCPRCAALDGKRFPIDSGPRPPLHAGPCRCSVSPIVKKSRMPKERASAGGLVPASVRFEEWIEEQSVAEQDEVFGRGRAELWRAGRIELADMVDAAGNVISLERILESL